MLNSIAIQGRLTAEPELRKTPTGTSVTSFTLACDRDFKDQNGNRETDFINCVAWRNSAEFIAEYFHKGDMMIAHGRLQIRGYTDKAGNKRTAAEVVIDSNYFSGTKKATGSADTNYAPGQFADLPSEGSDLPF